MAQSTKKSETNSNESVAVFTKAAINTSSDKKFSYSVPKNAEVVDMGIFSKLWEKSLSRYQLKREAVMNQDPKNEVKVDLLKTQVFNVQKIDSNILSAELILNLNKKSYYGNVMFLFSTGFDHKKFNIEMALKKFSDSLSEKKAISNLNQPDAIKNNVGRMKKLLAKMVAKNSNNVLLNIRHGGLTASHFDLYDSFLNSVQDYIASSFEIKTKSVVSASTDQI